ncbi:helix-turn-helix domain-containing protein [Szabonella alba]|uniref:Helix-turn-helix transcriptional regulator n=1 Tax=Szabonella alba TaxID=2804194 RepID=A0A8K0Y1A7_9RHOB|nr:helix-turn-helix transcriptional regulator [Szabonella alba]
MPQLFHRTDRFRFLEPGGRLAVRRVCAAQMVLARVWSTGHDVTLEEPERLTVLFPWAGRITCAVQDDMITAMAGGILAFAPNRRQTVVARPQNGPYMADVLTLPLRFLEEVQRDEDLRTGPVRPRPDALGSVMSRIRLRAGRMLTTGLLEPETCDDIACDLTLALANTDHPVRLAGGRRVDLAIALMRDRFAEPISMAALARTLGCSSRSVQTAFREAGHATPQEVLAGIRLDAARVRLLSGEASVTTCALDSGINHLGRFAHAYRRRFGENPAQTLSARG